MTNPSTSTSIASRMRALRPRLADPGRVALKSAARAAIVMPAVFAFADKVVQQPQSTIFAAFGSFAILVLAGFRGPPRKRLVAYVGLFAAGTVFITLGTLCSRDTWLGAGAMAVIGFGILFSSVINPYFAAAGFAALLTFILPVNIPAEASAIPQRLEGWALACGVGIPAAMLLWPPGSRDELREAAARACRALADLVAAELDGDRSRISHSAGAARAAVSALRRKFVSTPNRPTGATGSTEALAFLVDELDWFLSIEIPQAEGALVALGLCGEENREVMAAVASALRASAATLDGRDERPDLERLGLVRLSPRRSCLKSRDDPPNRTTLRWYPRWSPRFACARCPSPRARSVAMPCGPRVSECPSPTSRWRRPRTLRRSGVLRACTQASDRSRSVTASRVPRRSASRS